MRVWANPPASRKLLKELRDRRPARADLHLSGLIGCARLAWWQLHHPEDFLDTGRFPEDDEFTSVVALGKGFHNMVETGEEVTRSCMGILYTPDDLEVSEDGCTVIELKETRKSTKQTPLDGGLYNYVEQAAGYCMGPETRVLTSRLRWVELGSVRVGDTLAGFEEDSPGGRGNRRCWKTSVVEHIERVTLPCYQVVMADGTSMVASYDHKFLIYDSARGPTWRRVDELRAAHNLPRGDEMASKMPRLFKVLQEPSSWEAGYLAAAFDGEGCLSKITHRNGRFRTRLAMTQLDNEMLSTVKTCLDKYGIPYSIHGRLRDRCLTLNIGRTHGLMSFMSMFRPPRLMGKLDVDRLGVAQMSDTVSVKEIKFLGDQEVVSIQTSSRTFVSEGFGSHNCVLESERLGIKVNRARIIVMHICGDWRGSPMPKLVSWDLLFEDWELEDWKKELLRRKDMILKATEINQIPLAEHYAGSKYDRDWQCKYCPLKGTVCPGGGGERLPHFPMIQDMGEKSA